MTPSPPRSGPFDPTRLLTPLTGLLVCTLLAGIVRTYPRYIPPDFTTDLLLGRADSFHGVYPWAFYADIATGPVTLLLGLALMSGTLRPDCPYPLGSVLAAIAPTWNVSVEQLPFYLADRFGREHVSTAAESLARTFSSDARESRALDTIAWWLQGRDQGRTNNTMHPSGGSGVS